MLPRGRDLGVGALVTTCLLGLLAIEVVSAAKFRWSKRLPPLPTNFAQRPLQPGDRASSSPADRGLYIVVIGESSRAGRTIPTLAFRRPTCWLATRACLSWPANRC